MAVIEIKPQLNTRKMKKISTIYLYLSSFLLIFALTLSQPLEGQSTDPGHEGDPPQTSCWTCYSSPADKCSATSSCGMTACRDNTGTCFPYGSICSVIPNGCD